MRDVPDSAEARAPKEKPPTQAQSAMVGYKSANRRAGDQIGESMSKLTVVIKTTLMTSSSFASVERELCIRRMFIAISWLRR